MGGEGAGVAGRGMLERTVATSVASDRVAAGRSRAPVEMGGRDVVDGPRAGGSVVLLEVLPPALRRMVWMVCDSMDTDDDESKEVSFEAPSADSVFVKEEVTLN